MTDPLDPDSQPEEPTPAQDTPPPHEEEAAPSLKSASVGLNFPAMGLGQMGQKDEKFWASLGHLLSLSGILTAGMGYIVGPLIPFLLKKGESPFVDEHNKETLNFSIVTVIAILISSAAAASSSFILGCMAWPIPLIFVVLNLIYCIQGASAAREGRAYRYPFNWRIIK